MKDTELDEILNQWNVAAPSPSLREHVRAAFVAVQPMGVQPVALQPVTAPPVPKERRRLAFLPAARRALLAAAPRIPSCVFLGNNLAGSADMAAALGVDRDGQRRW